MTRRAQRLVALTLMCLATLSAGGALAALHQSDGERPAADFGAVFDEHWQRLRDDYPYFELYGVDWDAERAEHRPRAVAAADATELAWEMARLISAVDDPHVSYVPPPAVMKDWSAPEIRTIVLAGKAYVIDWGDHPHPVGSAPFAGNPRAYPEVVAIQDTPIGSAVEILAAGPVGTTFPLTLRWPDGHELRHELRRPDATNVTPSSRHYGERWIVTGRVGAIGYMRVRTFDPERGTLGPAGKMTPILRERLKELLDTDGLILDLQGNGGGLVGASDPFLSHFLEERRSYQWGNAGGQKRVLVPRSPRYRRPVVVLVDERSASGGEWSARILRDAGRATVVGGRTVGAEAAVHASTASDGSVVHYSAWPMIEPGVLPFQGRGVELDVALPLTIEDLREHGYEEALRRVRRARLAAALEVLGAPAGDLEALVELADDADEDPQR